MDHAVAAEAALHEVAEENRMVVAPLMLAAVTFLLAGPRLITLPLRCPRERLRRIGVTAAGSQITRVPAIAIRTDIPKRLTFTPRTTGGSGTIQARKMPTTTWILPGTMDILPAKLAAAIFTGLKAEIGNVSGLGVSTLMLLRTIMLPVAIGSGAATISRFTTIQITSAGTWPITLGSAPTSTSSILETSSRTHNLLSKLWRAKPSVFLEKAYISTRRPIPSYAAAERDTVKNNLQPISDIL